MKKLLFSSAMAVALLAASCSKEEAVVNLTDNTTSTLEIKLPGAMASTRSFGDGSTTTYLQYAIYDAETEALISRSSSGFDENGKATVQLALANGRSYKIAFFATYGDVGSTEYGWDPQNKLITVDYSKLNHTDYVKNSDGEWEFVSTPNYNQWDYDAFFGMYTTETITGPISDTVVLKRFLAQVNWASTEDFYSGEIQAVYGNYAENLVTKVKYTNVYTQYDFWNGKVTGDTTEAVFDFCARPTDKLAYPGDGENVEWVSVNYLLVPDSEYVVDATLIPSDGTIEYKEVSVPNLPVQANYQTLIEGRFLTSIGELTVTKDTAFTSNYYKNLDEDDSEDND